MENLDAKEWVKKAEEDIDTASYTLKGGKLSAAAFFAQQSAEKALKAIYIKKFSKLWKTHNLVELGKEINLPFDLLELCSELTAAYVSTRYPNIDEIYKRSEVENLVEHAKVILKWSKENLQQ